MVILEYPEQLMNFSGTHGAVIAPSSRDLHPICRAASGLSNSTRHSSRIRLGTGPGQSVVGLHTHAVLSNLAVMLFLRDWQT